MLKISQSTSAWLLILVFAALGLPSFVMVVGDIHLDPILSAMIFGHGIVGGAFLISWAAEAAQVDVSASFAITILALIAILPEYAVEAVLAWDAGQSYVLASQSGQVFSAGSADRLYFTYGYLLLSALIGEIYLYKWKIGSGFSS